MEKEKKEQCYNEAAQAAGRDEFMQSEKVKRKYGGTSEEKLEVCCGVRSEKCNMEG